MRRPSASEALARSRGCRRRVEASRNVAERGGVVRPGRRKFPFGVPRGASTAARSLDDVRKRPDAHRESARMARKPRAHTSCRAFRHDRPLRWRDERRHRSPTEGAQGPSATSHSRQPERGSEIDAEGSRRCDWGTRPTRAGSSRHRARTRRKRRGADGSQGSTRARLKRTAEVPSDGSPKPKDPRGARLARRRGEAVSAAIQRVESRRGQTGFRADRRPGIRQTEPSPLRHSDAARRRRRGPSRRSPPRRAPRSSPRRPRSCARCAD